MRHFCAVILLSFVAFPAFGQSPNFDSLSDEDVEIIVREFSGNLIHTTVTPPTSLGKVFGIEAAVVVGATESKGIDAITKRQDPNAEVPFLPHAWLLTNISVPYGVTIEVNALPELGLSGINFSHVSGGVKWSLTDQLFSSLPFDWAVRTYYSNSDIGFRQNFSNPAFPGITGNLDVSYTNQMMGLDNILGFDLGLAEPYVGVGYVSSKARLTGKTSSNIPYSIFDDGISESKNLTETSMRVIAGVQLALPLTKLSIEYTNVFSINRVSVKAGFAF